MSFKVVAVSFKRVLVTLALTPYLIYAQTNPDSISQRLFDYNSRFPQEKIYLHTDKPHYFPGDTIWFKAYLVEANTHLADTVSETVYIDLFKKDDSKKIIHTLVKNEMGFSHGYIPLPDSIKEGTYVVRSYTSWMRNFSESDFFHRELSVQKRTNIKNPLTQQIMTAYNEIIDLQFFPEGGNMIAGMQNRVAFKAINKFGKGVNFKAFIISSHQDTITAIQSQHLGMGSFIFQPKEGEKYFAVVEKAVKVKQFYFPESQPEGYTLFVDNMTYKDKIKVIARSNSTTKDRPILLGHVRGEVVALLKSGNESNSFTWYLPKADIDEQGIMQLTLFNSKGVPQCERLIYLDRKTPLQVSISSDKTVYSPREKVTLSIHVQDHLGEPVQGNFSLSAVDLGQVNPEVNGQNIYNYLYLSSDIRSLSNSVKGNIEQPDYYFNKSDPMAPVNLDILLMTQGWRRFQWPFVLEKQWSGPTYKVEQGFTLTGKAQLTNRMKKSDEPINISLSYFPGKEAMKYYNASADRNGNFTFSDLQFSNRTRIYLQAHSTKENINVPITIDSLNTPPYPSTNQSTDPLFFDLEQIKFFIEHKTKLAELDAQLNLSKTKLLREVVIKARRDIKIDDRKILYRGSMISKSIVVTNEMCGMYPTAFHMLQGRVTSMDVSITPNGPQITIRGQSSIRGNISPAILVDGVQYNADILMSIPSCSVESIDIINSIVPNLGTPGLVSILTKVGNTDWNQNEIQTPGANGYVFKVYGYQAAREFYSPKYVFNENDKNNLPDFRSTLYWNPMIKTDENGNATVTFWNSDEKTSVQISLEGISLEGVPTVLTKNYKVD